MTEVVPQLLDQLRTVEQKRPASNVSASIRRIRELIAQTRSVASKVTDERRHHQSLIDDENMTLRSNSSSSLWSREPFYSVFQFGSSQLPLFVGIT